MWWVGGCMCSDLCGDCMHTCGDSITVGKHHTQVMQPHHTAQSTSTLRGHCVGRIFDPHECLASPHFTHPVSAESYQGFQVSSPLVTKSITAHRCEILYILEVHTAENDHNDGIFVDMRSLLCVPFINSAEKFLLS